MCTKDYKQVVVDVFLKDPIKIASDHGGRPGRALACFVSCCGGRRTGQSIVTSQISDIIRVEMKRFLKKNKIEKHTNIYVRSRNSKNICVEIRFSNLKAALKQLLGHYRGTIASVILSNDQIIRKLSDEAQSLLKMVLKTQNIEGKVSCKIGNGGLSTTALRDSR